MSTLKIGGVYSLALKEDVTSGVSYNMPIILKERLKSKVNNKGLEKLGVVCVYGEGKGVEERKGI